MIPYIGDISKNDAELLKNLAEQAESILEFGCGASTQVLSEYSKLPIISIDTSQEWIDKTKKNIDLLEIKNKPSFYLYNEYMNQSLVPQFDLIFDDGVDDFRKDFALKIWPCLRVDGILAFHDTRRWQDARNVCHVLEQVYNEVYDVKFNYNHSNITLITKKIKEDWVNWQEVENRLPWQLGWGEPDIDLVKRHLQFK
jgi:predicted O-methyltransferase YrrM